MRSTTKNYKKITMTIMRKRKCLYIAGKISGEDYMNAYLKFDEAERKLKPVAKAINPMKICDKDWSWLRCMVICLWNLIFKCNRIYMLPDWTESRGAKTELFVALLLRKEIVR